MKAIVLTTLIIFGLQCNVFANQDPTNDPIVITKSVDLEPYVGKEITIKGLVTNTKIPTINGVDVSSYQPDMRNQHAEAKGILEKWVVKPSKNDSEVTRRGPGTYYRLVDPVTGELAKALPMTTNN